MARRTLLLVAAVLLAAMGTGVLFLYIQSTTKAPDADSAMTEVLVPETPIPAGVQITDGTRFVTTAINKELAGRAGMITDRRSVIGLFAVQDLQALTPVTRKQFSKSFVGQPRIPLGKNTMNLAVQVNDPAKVGEFLYPGAKIAVWVIDPETTPAATTERTSSHRVKLILSGIEVVTIGARGTLPEPTAGAATAARGSASIVILKVDQEQAATVLMAQAAGELYFTLLGDTPATPKTYDDRVLTDIPDAR